MPAYRDSKTSTWFVKFRYQNWRKETKWVTKRGFSSKRAALQWERNFLQTQAGGLKVPFQSFSEKYLTEIAPRIKESTMQTKRNIIEQQIIPYFQDLELQNITTTDVMHWQNELLKHRDPKTGKPYSKSYLKTVHNQLSAIFNHAVRYYHLPSNPAREVGNMGSEKDIKMRFWTKEEYLRFSEEIMDEPLAYYCFEVLYWCGLREGELLALTPADFDLQAKTVTVSKTFRSAHGKEIITEPKTPKSNRVVAMPDFLCEEIEDYFEMIYDLNPTARAFPITKSYLHRHIHSGAKAAGLQEIRCTICATPMCHYSLTWDSAPWPLQNAWGMRASTSLTAMPICFPAYRALWLLN